ncbi:MAG: uracil-DNA glycosylase [Ignavibacteriae bacterium]|nr:MAG: uracil-DNA glycosylase [Ignavibacteriota bacterium]
MENYKNLIIEALKDQQEIFGDNLFQKIDIDFNSIQENILVKEQTVKYMKKNIKPNDFSNIVTLDDFHSRIDQCQKCNLGKTRTNFVFGSGNPNADVMIIGEAPGAEEDKKGLPFVGRAGKLLTDILKAINFERDEVYIANILKCRPPNNRNPLPAEMDECMPFLYKQIDIIKPKAILMLGLVAATGLLKQKTSLTKLRGNVFEINGVKSMVTYHPAALLRNPNWKRSCWEDVQKFKKLYDDLNK